MCIGYSENGSLAMNILLWSCFDYDVLAIVNTTDNDIIASVVWDPIRAYEFVTVGMAKIEFWMLQMKENMADLKVHKPNTNQSVCDDTNNY